MVRKNLFGIFLLLMLAVVVILLVFTRDMKCPESAHEYSIVGGEVGRGAFGTVHKVKNR
jgi:hypothetical protein